jgi:hypothetical protein
MQMKATHRRTLESRARATRRRLAAAREALREPVLSRDGCDADSLSFFVEVFFLPGLLVDADRCERVIVDRRIDADIRWDYRLLRAELAEVRDDVSEVIATQRPIGRERGNFDRDTSCS